MDEEEEEDHTKHQHTPTTHQAYMYIERERERVELRVPRRLTYDCNLMKRMHVIDLCLIMADIKVVFERCGFL